MHLDCCLSYEVVNSLDGSVTEEKYRQDFRANGKCDNLAQYLARAARCVELMQSRRALDLVTDDLFRQLKSDFVAYAEIRFAPLLHVHSGLTPSQVVDIVDRAVSRNIEATGVKAKLILCTLRHFGEDQSMLTAKLVQLFSQRNVVALDLAADEAKYPIDHHVKAFQYVRVCGLQSTAHAGEACDADSVWETIQKLRPNRIGHGVRSSDRRSLVKHLVEHQIHLEICPTSNIQTNIYADISEHPVDQFLRSGVSIGINTDGRTISNITLSEEYEQLRDTFGWEQADFLAVNLNAVDAAFAAADEKATLKTTLLDAYQS